MKKTILTAAACLLMVSGVIAETTSTNFNATTENVVKVELSTFCKAILKGDIDTVKRLIDLGEDVNKKSLGMTPAIFAARYNKADILKVLIANKADLTIKCNKGWTILKHAQLSNAKDVLVILQENS
jgi:ankyrin repeat protein